MLQQIKPQQMALLGVGDLCEEATYVGHAHRATPLPSLPSSMHGPTYPSTLISRTLWCHPIRGRKVHKILFKQGAFITISAVTWNVTL